MNQKTIEYNGQTFIVGVINVQQAEEIFSGSLKPAEMNRKLVAAAVPQIGDASTISTMPWPLFKQLLAATLEVNGLLGETKGAPDQAASAPLVVSTPAS